MFVSRRLNTYTRFTFSGGTNVTLRGVTDPNWGWVDAHGQAVSPLYAHSRDATNEMFFLQWWDANQQTNRPHGFAFSKVSGGTIRDMKIWKVLSSASYSSFQILLCDLPAHRLELCNQRILERSNRQQSNLGCIYHRGTFFSVSLVSMTELILVQSFPFNT